MSASVLQVLRRPTLSLRCLHRCYSTPKTGAATEAQKPKAPTAAAPKSSCASGTVIPAVNYLKGQAPVTALADEEYPSWLWTVLEPKVYPDDGPGGKLERVTRKKERQRAIKDRNFMSTQ